MRVKEYIRIPEVSSRVWKVWLRNKDVFMKTVKVNFIPPFLEPILYLFSIGFGLGLYVGEIEGVSYAMFIAPALIAASMMNSAFFECTFSSYVRMYFQKTFDAIVSTPLNIDEVIMGEILWGSTKSLINATIILLVVSFFRLVKLPEALLIIPLSLLVGLAFSAIAMCFTAISPSIDAFNYPTFLFITPMFLFSGTFFPLSSLPKPIQALSVAIFPLTHAVIVARGATTGSLGPHLAWSVAWLAIVGVILTILSVNL
ncbi:MAG: ABC transporter permease, partial [Candidatus Bathyarchaeia archaeon]